MWYSGITGMVRTLVMCQCQFTAYCHGLTSRQLIKQSISSRQFTKMKQLLESRRDEYKSNLIRENAQLSKNIENLKTKMSQFVILSRPINNNISDTAPVVEENPKEATKVGTTNQPIEVTVEISNGGDLPKEKKNKNKPKASPKSDPADSAPVDVGRLDFRIGKILEAEKHPDADSLYIEKIDVGEAQPRTVVSGLVRFIPVEELVNKMVVVMCNLKPAKMRGITSQAMVMCASTPEKVELLVPPPNCIPGDVIEVDGFPRIPDVVLNPKKKIFEACTPDLKTSSDLVATFKGVPWEVKGKGIVRAPSLAGVQIK